MVILYNKINIVNFIKNNKLNSKNTQHGLIEFTIIQTYKTRRDIAHYAERELYS